MARVARRLLIGLLACALWVRPAAAGQSDQDPFAQIDAIVVELGRISGLKPHDRIRHDRIARAQLQQFLEQRIKDEVKPEEIRAEELTLKKFGLVPADFDLKKTTVDLLTEQAAAFYDFRKRKLFVIDSVPELEQRTALVHELAHALADQHFNLQRFIDRAKHSDDGSTARLAVMEGQATWLMSEYLAERSGQSLRDSPALLKLMSGAVEASAGHYPVFDRSPLYLRQMLLFPYTQGMLFQHAIIEKLGQAAFAEVFRRPPESTQQILHPDRYLADAKPASPALPALGSERGYRRLAEGSIGELDHAILLRQYVGEKQSEALAPAWRGGSYKLLERKQDGRLVLAYASQWENEAAAQQYFRLYRQVLQGKWKSFAVSSESGDRLAGRGDDGYFLLRRAGPGISSLEGLESPEDAKRPGATLN
jgi:hypothetical protein